MPGPRERRRAGTSVSPLHGEHADGGGRVVIRADAVTASRLSQQFGRVRREFAGHKKN